MIPSFLPKLQISETKKHPTQNKKQLDSVNRESQFSSYLTKKLLLQKLFQKNFVSRHQEELDIFHQFGTRSVLERQKEQQDSSESGSSKVATKLGGCSSATK
jgi:predicted transcriptional regulator